MIAPFDTLGGSPVEVTRQQQADFAGVPAIKLQLAEQILAYSERNIDLTMQILMQVSNDRIEPVLSECVHNKARIAGLVQRIRHHIRSKQEMDLLDAASRRSTHGLTIFRNVDTGAAMANVMLPLLLDNNSWQAFVHFLRAQARGEQKDEGLQKLAKRTCEVVRANQKLKSVVAEHERVEERLSQLTSIIECANDAIVVCTLGGAIVSWNPGAETVYGYSASEVLGQSRDMLVAPDQSDPLCRAVRKVNEGESDQSFETVHIRKGGQRIHVSMAISPVKDANGRIIGAALITRDISDRIEAEEKFYKAFNASPEPITIATLAEGRFVDVNESFLQLTGCTREEVIGRTSLDVHFWDRAEDRVTLTEALKEQGSVRDLEFTFLTKFGEQRTGLNSAEVVDIAGQTCVLTIFKDITEQKILERQRQQAEDTLALRADELTRSNAALRQSEANFRSLVTNSPYAIFRSSAEGKFLDTNPALLMMLGYTDESELLTQAPSVTGCGEMSESLVGYFSSCVPFRHIEVGWKRKDEKRITVNLTGRPNFNVDGQLKYFEVVAEDITERKALEAKLRQAQRMESIGRLSGAIAHDFNNLLSVIIGYSGVLEERFEGSVQSRKNIEEIKKAAQRAASLTRQLLVFSRQQVLEPKVLNLNTAVAAMGKMLRRLIGEHIELSTILDPKLACIKADHGQIEQVIMNLAVNARDAMPQGGKLRIETENVELDEEYVKRHPAAVPGNYVMLTVSDTGTGMDNETQSHIFEPFFTTKEKDKGTGLGLAVVYGVVKQSGGYISVSSQLGKGTIFKAYLPSVEDAVEETHYRNTVKSVNGTETILLVEDEEALRVLTRDVLKQSGYTVLESSNGTEALEIAHRQRGRINLLLTDVVLPGLSGRVVAEKISALYPQTKVLFMSGYTDSIIAAQGVMEQGMFLLQKPFAPDELRAKIRTVLD